MSKAARLTQPSQIVTITMKQNEFGDYPVVVIDQVIDTRVEFGLYCVESESKGACRMQRFSAESIQKIHEDY